MVPVHHAAASEFTRAHGGGTDEAWVSRHAGWLILLVCLAAFLLYKAVAGHSFLEYDDGFFVTRNGYVSHGLTWAGFLWSWSALLGFYHPITWLSLMLDSTLFGLNPAGFHLTNLWLHLANTALVYGFLRRATRETGKSLGVACLFAWHPVNVGAVRSMEQFSWDSRAQRRLGSQSPVSGHPGSRLRRSG